MRVWTLFEDTNPQTRHAGAAREDAARTGPLSGTSRRKALTPEMAEEWAREIGPEGGLEDFLGGGDMLTPPPALAAREQPPPLPRARPRARQKRVRTPLQQQANRENTRRLRADPAYAAEVARQREENSHRSLALRMTKCRPQQGLRPKKFPGAAPPHGHRLAGAPFSSSDSTREVPTSV